MKTPRNQLSLIVAASLIPALGWAAPPGQFVSRAGHDALLGCRWRRCATVVRVMPRADEPVRLRLNFDKGPSYYAEMTTETKQVMKVIGQEVMQTQTQTFYLRMTPLGMNQHDDALLRTQIIGIKMKIDIGGVNIEYDSTLDRPSPAPLGDFFNKLLDADLKLTIDPTEMKVRNIEGHDELIRKLGVTSPQMEPLLKSIISQDALAQMIQPVFDFVPRQAVRRGDTWERPHTLDLGPVGSYRNTTQYTYDRMAGNLVRILVKNKLHYEAPTEKAGLPFQIKDAVLAANDGGGEITFDAVKGRLVESTQRQAIAGTLTIEVGGVITPVVLDQGQTVRIWVTERNPLLGRK